MVSNLDFIMIVIENCSTVSEKSEWHDIFYDFKRTTLVAKQKIDLGASSMRGSRETGRRLLKKCMCEMTVTWTRVRTVDTTIHSTVGATKESSSKTKFWLNN